MAMDDMDQSVDESRITPGKHENDTKLSQSALDIRNALSIDSSNTHPYQSKVTAKDSAPEKL